MRTFISTLLFICLTANTQAQLLWKVSGNGLSKPSYIFGTHHLVPLSVKDSIVGLSEAQESTQQVYGELKMSDIQSKASIENMQKMMMIQNDTTLQSLLTPEEYKSVNQFCKEYLMLDLDLVPKIKPAALLNNIVVAAYVKHIGNFNSQEQLDTYFQNQAIQKGKKVEGLETSDFQFNLLFNSSSLVRQARLLMCAFNDIDRGVENLKELTAAYMKQDLNAMQRISEERSEDMCDPLPEEEDNMNYNRNKAWIGKLEVAMKDTPTLVVVGALHLPGEKGLLNLLSQQGYTVSPVR